MIDTKLDRDVVTIGMTNFFIKPPLDRKPGKDIIIMKIKEDMLVQMYPEKCGLNVVYEKLKKVLYLEVLKAIYGMLKSALLS